MPSVNDPQPGTIRFRGERHSPAGEPDQDGVRYTVKEIAWDGTQATVMRICQRDAVGHPLDGTCWRVYCERANRYGSWEEFDGFMEYDIHGDDEGEWIDV